MITTLIAGYIGVALIAAVFGRFGSGHLGLNGAITCALWPITVPILIVLIAMERSQRSIDNDYWRG
jgi:hypothetical protein